MALHDRSWIQRGPNKMRKPEPVRAAQNKFAEFLNAVQTSGNPGAYPYPMHLTIAEAYLRSPQPSSLQIK